MSIPGLRSFDRVAHVYDDTRGMPPDVAGGVTTGLLYLMFRVWLLEPLPPGWLGL